MDTRQRIITKIHALEQLICEVKASVVSTPCQKSNEYTHQSSSHIPSASKPAIVPLATAMTKRTSERKIPELYPSERSQCSSEWLSLHDALLQLANSNSAAPFRFSVYEMYEPLSLVGYDRVVKNPMDFSRILSGILRGTYRSEEGVYADIELIWKNCEAFNGRMHPLVLTNIPRCQDVVAEIRTARKRLPDEGVDIDTLRRTVMEKIEQLQIFDPDSLDELVDFLHREVPQAISVDANEELTLELNDETLKIQQLQAIESFLKPKLERRQH